MENSNHDSLFHSQRKLKVWQHLAATPQYDKTARLTAGRFKIHTCFRKAKSGFLAELLQAVKTFLEDVQ